VDSQRVFLAMADPGSEGLISEIEFTSSRRVLVCVALKGFLERAINQSYAAKARGELEYRGELADDVDPSSEGAMSFIYAEELSHVPKELLDSVGETPLPSKPPLPPKTASKGADPKSSDPEPALEEEISFEEIPIEFEPDRSGTPGAAPKRTVSKTEPTTGAKAPARSIEPQRVLVIDDDPEIRRLVSRLLKARSIQVDEASRGLEALSIIKKMPPDLIVLDAMLPEVHGFDICRKIKSSDRYGHIPVIMISSIYRGWRFAQDLKDTYKVEAFLEKPFELDDLWNTVERVLAGTKRKGQNTRQISTNAKKAIQLGIKRYKSGDLDGAIESYREGLHIDPLSAKLHYQLAILYLKKKGMTYQAIQEFEEALALEPDLFSALRNLAILYQSKGFKNKAIDMWERALRSSPDDETREHIRKHLLSLI
jgi:CheY-like chemotaxis protein